MKTLATDTDPISEARRYVANARTILSEQAGKDGNSYTDREYVKLAGHALYTGVLVALDGILPPKGKGRKTIEWYKAEVAKLDRKLLNNLDEAYEILNLYLGYEGTKNVGLSREGILLANTIIDWAETRLSTSGASN
jgi:hypothetical protein